MAVDVLTLESNPDCWIKLLVPAVQIGEKRNRSPRSPRHRRSGTPARRRRGGQSVPAVDRSTEAAGVDRRPIGPMLTAQGARPTGLQILRGASPVPHLANVWTAPPTDQPREDKVDYTVRSRNTGYAHGTSGIGHDNEHWFKAGMGCPDLQDSPGAAGPHTAGQNRFGAIDDDEGNFTIDGVPDGAYELGVVPSSWRAHRRRRPRLALPR